MSLNKTDSGVFYFGVLPEEEVLIQASRHLVDNRCVFMGLMSDCHLGYSTPIGGVAVYKDVISPSGVGFDISCIVEGSEVTTGSGELVRIEDISKENVGLTMKLSGSLVETNITGVSCKEVEEILEIELENGDFIRLTEDHLLLTEYDGVKSWREANSFSMGDRIMVSPYIGCKGKLTKHHIFMRILGYLMGDGHLPRDSNRSVFYSSIDKDADSIAKDIEKYYEYLVHQQDIQKSISVNPNDIPSIDTVNVGIFRRDKKTITGKNTRENCVYFFSSYIRKEFELYGCPVGKKEFDISRLHEIFSNLSLVDKSNFIGGILGAEAGCPKIGKNNVFNPWIKMGGINGRDFLEFISSLLEEFDFESHITLSTEEDGEKKATYVLQIIGGMDEFERFYRTFKFFYSDYKEIEKAKVLSYIWSKKKIVNKKIAARELCRFLRSQGCKVNSLHKEASKMLGYEVNKRFALRSIYEDCGDPRISEEKPIINTNDQGIWVKIVSINKLKEKTKVYDIGIDHVGHNFIANGVVVHNCGNKAVKLNIKGVTIRKDIKKIIEEISKNISFGVGRCNNKKVDHELFDDPTWNLDCIKEISRGVNKKNDLRDMAISQLGTIGSGNHYLDLFVDENDDVWIGVHFGSRGLGHKIATYFLHEAGGKDDINAYPTLISVNSDLGQEYISCMKLAGRYAYAGRDWVCNTVANILRGKIIEEVHNNHNFAFEETHFGESYWVIRKGATPAFPGQKGFVGGSMGDNSVIIEGVDSEESRQSFYSTVHGAGRVMGRMEAKGKFKQKKDSSGKKTGEFECVREPKVKKEDMLKWIKEKGVELYGADVDESPFVYKRLNEVLGFHSNTIKILHDLQPIAVMMAGNERDPYKD